MAVKMKWITVLSVLSTIITFIWYENTEDSLALTFVITLGTIAYHFVMRLAVGYLINGLLNNHIDYRKKWFHITKFEQKLYKQLKVKRWKKNIPAYDPQCFDPAIHTWDEIAQAMCQAEIVHEVIMILSFIPILAAIPFGELWVFVITSILAACLDAAFVMIQRYNRPRIIKLIRMNKT